MEMAQHSAEFSDHLEDCSNMHTLVVEYNLDIDEYDPDALGNALEFLGALHGLVDGFNAKMRRLYPMSKDDTD